jgi:predicted nuclease with TOPRIM domain
MNDDSLENLDREIRRLEEKKKGLEQENEDLKDSLDRAYDQLMSEFERRWPYLSTLGS